MNYKKTVSAVAHKTGYRVRDVREVLDALGEVVADGLRNEGEIKPIKGLTLYKKTMSGRGGYDPYRDIQIEIPQRFKLCSRFTNSYKKTILNKGE